MRQILTPLFAALLLIAVVELALPYAVPQRPLYYTEVDNLVNDSLLETVNAPYVLIGDSVLPSVTNSQPLPKALFANLARNQAIEMPGNYFLVRRYLEIHQKPKAIIFVGLNPFGKNLVQPAAETYVRRVFLRFSEIWDLFEAKRDLRFTLGQLIYKFLPTYRFRDSIRSKIGYPAEFLESPKADASSSTFSILSLSHFLNDAPADLSKYYFEKLLGMLDAQGIDFYFLHTGISQNSLAIFGHTVGFQKSFWAPFSMEELDSYLSGVAKKHPSFHYSSEVTPVFPDSYFRNEGQFIHFNEAGGPFYRKALLKQLTHLLNIDPKAVDLKSD